MALVSGPVSVSDVVVCVAVMFAVVVYFCRIGGSNCKSWAMSYECSFVDLGYIDILLPALNPSNDRGDGKRWRIIFLPSYFRESQTRAGLIVV